MNGPIAPADPVAPGRSRRRAVALAAALVLASIPLLATQASAQQINLSTTSVPRGGTIQLSGDGCFTGATPPLQFTVVGPSAFPNAGITGFNWSGVTGQWTATLVVPASAALGSYVLTVRCRSQFAYSPQTFTVTGTTVTTAPPPTTAPPTTTPTTGPATTVPPAPGTSRICAELFAMRQAIASQSTSGGAFEAVFGQARATVIARIDTLLRQYGCV